MHGDLDNFLEQDDHDTTPEAAAPPAPEVVAESDKGVTPPEAPATPEAAAAPPAADPENQQVPLAAVLAERRKRQEAEQRLQQLQQQAPQPQLPDFFANPEEHVQTAIKQNTVQMSAAMVEQQYPDFREKLAVFMEEAQRNPVLQAELEAHPHPALYAYTKAKEIADYREFRSSGGLETLKKQAFEEGRQAALAEMQKQQGAHQALVASLPPDLSTARGAKPPSEDLGVDEPLEKILKR